MRLLNWVMVDDLIKDKDNSRRRMLEQAAGISIYKTRKKEAKLKLGCHGAGYCPY